MSVYIYGLRDPETKLMRYVGKVSQRHGETIQQSLQRRKREHCYPSSLKRWSHKNHWIKSLQLRGLYPDILLLDVGDRQTWQHLERFYIASLTNSGFSLTNHSLGGQGCNGFKWSENAKLQFGLRVTGRRHTKESRNKMSITKKMLGLQPPSRLGIPHSLETREKMRMSRQRYLTTMKKETL